MAKQASFVTGHPSGTPWITHLAETARADGLFSSVAVKPRGSSCVITVEIPGTGIFEMTGTDAPSIIAGMVLGLIAAGRPRPLRVCALLSSYSTWPQVHAFNADNGTSQEAGMEWAG